MIQLSEPVVEAPLDAAKVLLKEIELTRIGISANTELALATGIARYRLTPEASLQRGEIFHLSYRWGWRFFISVERHLLPAAIDVRPGPDAGCWRAGLAHGPRLADQLRALEKLDGLAEVDGEVRLFEAPGLDWVGIWVAGERERLFVLPSLRPVNPFRLLSRLRSRVKRRARVHDHQQSIEEEQQTLDRSAE